jgi:hypothetical protein
MSRRVVTRLVKAASVVAVLSGSVLSVSDADASASGAKGCLAKNIKVTFGPTFGAAGTSIQVIVFKNAGRSSCALAGNPTVGFIAVPGTRPEYEAVPIVSVGNFKTPSGNPRKTLVKPGGTASVTLLGGDVQIAHNPDVTWVSFEVALPGQSSGTTFSRSIGSYSGFKVTEFTKGSSGGT